MGEDSHNPLSVEPDFLALRADTGLNSDLSDSSPSSRRGDLSRSLRLLRISADVVSRVESLVVVVGAACACWRLVSRACMELIWVCIALSVRVVLW